MRFTDFAWPCLAFLCASCAADADFYQVRTKMEKNLNVYPPPFEQPRGKYEDAPIDRKYFKEAAFHNHYDGRFGDQALEYSARKKAVQGLMKSFLATAADLKLEAWLMHSTLLGWWWEQKILPWEVSVSVSVSEESLAFLAAYHNMTIWNYKFSREWWEQPTPYLLEVNPHYVEREEDDENGVDARWIDTNTGVFLDIMAARRNETHPEGKGNILSYKAGDEFNAKYIYPLHDSKFEGIPVKIPYDYQKILETEFSPEALSFKSFNNHYFDDAKGEWLPKTQKLLDDSAGSVKDTATTELEASDKLRIAAAHAHA